jgi:hypothetical protein
MRTKSRRDDRQTTTTMCASSWPTFCIARKVTGLSKTAKRGRRVGRLSTDVLRALFQLRVPHPCVLCKGGRVDLWGGTDRSRSVVPTLRKTREGWGTPCGGGAKPDYVLFPQPSTERIPPLVTNNLYRGFQNAHARSMRGGSLNNFSIAGPKRGSRPVQSDVKSLFLNILAASPSGSILCLDRVLPATHKPLRMNTLA